MSPKISPANETGTAAGFRSSDLCLDCGLCCDGAIFTSVVLADDEVEGAKALGLAPYIEDDRAYFGQPCPRFSGICEIYADRPLRCREFRCVLLKRLDEREVEWGEAQALVREARRLAVQAEAASPAGKTRVHARERWERDFAAMSSNPSGSPRPADPRWLLAMTALNHFLDRHFREPKQRRLTEASDPPPSR